jgi:hypothetical protein
MVAKSGDRLLREDAVEALRDVLLPLATVVTPNLPEAETLLGRRVRDRDAMNAAAIDLLRLGPRAVVVKGGHLAGGDSTDVLALAGETTVRWFQAPRAATPNTHGTGCTYSSAIAAGLARGATVADAVEQAKRYLTGAITAGATFKLGTGHGPVHHFHALWPSDSPDRGARGTAERLAKSCIAGDSDQREPGCRIAVAGTAGREPRQLVSPDPRACRPGFRPRRCRIFRAAGPVELRVYSRPISD